MSKELERLLEERDLFDFLLLLLFLVLLRDLDLERTRLDRDRDEDLLLDFSYRSLDTLRETLLFLCLLRELERLFLRLLETERSLDLDRLLCLLLDFFLSYEASELYEELRRSR